MTLEELLAQAQQQGMQSPGMQPQGLDIASLMAPTMPPMDFSAFQPGGMVDAGAPQVSPLHANFLDRLGLAFQQLPPVDASQSGGASLLQGLMQGFGASRGGGFQREQAANTAENAKLSESARHMAQTRWQNYQMEAQKLKAQRATADAQVAAQRQAKQDARAEGYYQLAQRKANEPKPSDPNVVEPLSDEAVFMESVRYATTGIPPSTGFGAKGIQNKNRIINKTAQLFPGLNPGASLAGFQADKGSLMNMRRIETNMGAFEQTALKNLKVLEDAAAKIPDTGSPFLNRPIRALALRGAGSAEVAAYNAAREVVVPEFARILASTSGSNVVPEEERKQIRDKMVRGDYSIKQLMETIRVLTTDAANRRRSYSDAVSQIEQGIGARGTVTPASGADHAYIRSLGLDK